MFCPKCGSLLRPKDFKGKRLLACSCGYKDQKSEKIELSEKKTVSSNVDVVDKEVEVYPLTDVECPKCKHGKAHYWTVQTRASDEPETKFFKCEKCKHTWRDYS